VDFPNDQAKAAVAQGNEDLSMEALKAQYTAAQASAAVNEETPTSSGIEKDQHEQKPSGCGQYRGLTRASARPRWPLLSAEDR
jgi:hypothetical protein